MINPKLKKTIVVLHISAVIYILLGILLLTILADYFAGGFLLVFVSFGMAIFVEIVIKGLKQEKFWAWVTSVVICSIYIPSGFIIFGIIGLVGLLNKDVRKDFLKK